MFDANHIAERVADAIIGAVSGSTIDCADGKRYFFATVAQARTWRFANVPASGAVVVVLELTNGGTGTQTWPTQVKWPGGTAPTLTSSGVDVLAFLTDDGGAAWRGVVLMTDSK